MKAQKKVLILGATGMLGHKLCLQLSASQEFQVFTTIRNKSDPKLDRLFPKSLHILSHVDASSQESYSSVIKKISPDVVINCIGLVKQNQEAKNYASSIAINSLFPHLVAQECKAAGARMIHISTDCVFSGNLGSPYAENSNSDADDLYGKSKFLGEVIDQPHAITLRTSIIGREIMHPTGLLEWFLAQKNQEIKGFSKALYSGLTTNLAADVIMEVILNHPKLSGLYQVATAAISKYDLLQIANEIYKVGAHIKKDDNFFCDRRLDGTQFEKATGWKAAAWPGLIEAMYQQDLNLYQSFWSQ